MLLWWGSSTAFNVFTKTLLRVDEKFYLINTIALTWYQLLFSSILYLLYLKLSSQNSITIFSTSSINHGFTHYFHLTKTIAAMHCLGALSTNMTISVSSISSSTVYKALEPIFVVTILFLIFPDQFKKESNNLSLLSICLVVIGVILAGKSNTAGFNLKVLVAAFCANTFFSIRTVLIKDVQKKDKPQVNKTENGEDTEKLLGSNDGINLGSLENATQTIDNVQNRKLDVYEIFGACCIFGFAYNTIILVTLIVLTPLVANQTASQDCFDIISKLLSLDTFNSGVCYFAYNLLSFMVLANVTAASHSLLKAGKRISILIGAAVFSHEIINLKTWTGVYVAIIGMISYSLFKGKELEKVGMAEFKTWFFRCSVITISIAAAVFFTGVSY